MLVRDPHAGAQPGRFAMSGLSRETELMFRLIAPRAQRIAERERILALLAETDPQLLARTLGAHSILALGLRRLVELEGIELDSWLEQRLEVSEAVGRRHATHHQVLTVRLVRTLAERGIDSMTLKGPFMGESLYGDPGLRPSCDIDILVDSANLEAATEALLPLGYARARDARNANGLPEIHQTLEPPAGPNVELHWRVHWNERGFAQDLLARTTPDDWRGGVPRPEDELAILLISLAKDAFIGLRYVADVSAWWDVHGGDWPEPPLAETLRAHPELRSPIMAAARVVERIAGVPALALHGETRAPSLRARLAVRLADPVSRRSHAEATSELSLVDLLLSPWRRVPSVLRRHREISHTHGLRARTNGNSRRLEVLRYDAEGILKLIPRFFAICGRVRQGPVRRTL